MYKKYKAQVNYKEIGEKLFSMKDLKDEEQGEPSRQHGNPSSSPLAGAEAAKHQPTYEQKSQKRGRMQEVGDDGFEEKGHFGAVVGWLGGGGFHDEGRLVAEAVEVAKGDEAAVMDEAKLLEQRAVRRRRRRRPVRRVDEVAINVWR